MGKHDIVLNHYARNWSEGMPIGNGELGSLVFGSPDRLSFTLNRSRVWDYRYQDPDPKRKETFARLKALLRAGDVKQYKAFVKEREQSYSKQPYPLPQSCGRLQLHFPADCSGFSQTLKTDQAKVLVSFTRDGRKRLVESFVPPELPLLLIKITFLGKPEPFDISLNRDGLGITEDSRTAHASLDRIKITYPGQARAPQMNGKLPDGLSFAAGFQIKGGKLKKVGTGRWTVFPETSAILISAGVTTGYDKDRIHKELPQLILRGFMERDRLEQRHLLEWKRFWSSSGITMPDPFLEDLWYLDLYLLNSTLKYAQLAPGLFGLWTYMDMPPWHGDYHLDRNAQAVLEPLFAANHPELANSYFRFFASVLPFVKKNTKRFYGWDGAAFPGSMGPRGENLGGYFTVGYWEGASAWLCLLYWWGYKFTMDKIFLRETAYPFMKECVRFYEGYLGKPGKDGRYHLWPSYLPETGANDIKAWGTDSAIDVGLLRFLFKAIADGSKILNMDAGDRKRWQSIAKKLPYYPIWDESIVDYREWPELHVKRGLFTDDLRIAPIYPIGEITLDSPKKELALGIKTFWSLEKHHVRRWLLTDGTAAFRMGIKNMGFGYLKAAVRCVGPNGFGHCTAGMGSSPAHDGIRAKHAFSTDHAYSVFGIEMSANVVAAINEMLMQSCGKAIRVFPGVPDTWSDVSFNNLRAEGAFLVSAAMCHRRVVKVTVKSLAGGTLRVVNPWGKGPCRLNHNGQTSRLSGKSLEMATTANECYEFTLWKGGVR